MSRSDEERIDDILHAAERSAWLVAEGEEAFESDWKNPLVGERLLHIVGEAANGLSDDATARYPQVPWQLIRGLRNRITHEYHRLSPSVIWETLAVSVPDLARTLVDKPLAGSSSDQLTDEARQRLEQEARSAAQDEGGETRAHCGFPLDGGQLCTHPEPTPGGRCAAGHPQYLICRSG